MPLARESLIRTARLLVGALLFAQGLAIAQTCMEEARPAMAFQGSAFEESAIEESDCHQPANPNDCLQQCTAGDQSSAYAQVFVAGLPGLAVLTVPAATDHDVRPAAAILSLAHPPDPPPSIRFCSFQI